MRRLLLPVALALSAASPAAFGMDPALRGFYLGAGIGEATVELEDNDSPIDFEGDDTGFKLIAGYRIIDWVAVEVNYTNYGKPRDRVLGVNVETQFKAFSASAIGLLPLGDFDLFGRLGIARVEGDIRAVDFDVSESDDETDPLFGLGGQYRHGNLAIRAEWEAIALGFDEDDDDNDADEFVSMLSVGFTYKF
jgi:opacity protein-like surface antigen